MKRLSLSIFLLCAALMASAQSVDAQIQKIRDFYNLVQEQAKKGYSTENPIGTAVIDHIATYSAVGYIKGRTEIYTYLYDGEEFDDELFNTQQVVMIRENFERGPWQKYREYLYDPETREPIFCYFHDMNPDTGEFDDHRFYFSKGKLLKALPASSASKAKSALTIANGMKDYGRSVFENSPTDL
ncbi:MAG: hypothetical protein IKH22_08275 [Prevotella sp.]|nr:hypothetical protein [Prevotella sp.]